MIRLFIAIDIPEDIRILICSMGGSIPGARTVPAEQLHLTLKFIGDTELSMVDEIIGSLHEIHHPPITFGLKKIGHFPPRGKPRILWAGITPSQEIIRLRNTIEYRLSVIGVEKETRKYSPHITLARLKNSPIRRVTDFLAGNSLFETPQFTVNSFQLYSSKLTAKGAIHTVEESFTFKEGR